jgi:hypothetical protein
MKHITINEVNPDNYRLYVEKPNKNFSPQKNYAVISQVIAENDKMQTEISGKVKENAGNVADILSSFAKYKLDIGGSKQIEQWLGKSWMTKIYGERLIDKIRMMDILQRQNRTKGNTKFINYYLK